MAIMKSQGHDEEQPLPDDHRQPPGDGVEIGLR